MYLLMRKRAIQSQIILAKRIEPTTIPLHDCSCSIVDIATNNSITMRSCTMRIPIDNLPETDSVPPLSESSLSITMVLEKAKPIPIYKATIGSNPNKSPSPYPIAEVRMTCITPVVIADFHTSCMILGFSSSQTINNRKLIPILENISIEWVSWRSVGKKRLISVPAIIYPMIIGCLSIFIIPILTRTTPMTILR